MLVIRIAIIRVAAAGVRRSPTDIVRGILPPRGGRVKQFISPYIHAWIS
jgi:hypothetical protein